MPLPPPRLETPRLYLRARTPDDIGPIVAMDSDEEVRRCIGGRLDPVSHAAHVRRNVVDGRPLAYPAWTIEWKDRPGFLGMCALNASHLPGATEIGWRLPRSSWGQGLASEAAAAVLRYAAEVLRADPVVALVHPDNRASIRVAEKIGLRPSGETVVWGTRQQIYRRLD